MNVPVVLLGILLTINSRNKQYECITHEKIDWLGSIISMATLSLLTLGLVKMKDWGMFNLKTVGCFLISTVFFEMFIHFEKKIEQPMINLNLFKVKNFSSSAIIALLAQFFYIGVVVVIPNFLTNVQQKNELESALILLPMSLTVFAFGGLGSLAINKLGPRLLVFIGIFCILWSYILIIVNQSKNPELLSIALLILGIGFGIIAGPINVLAANKFSGTLLTSSQSVISVIRQIGSILGVCVFLSMMSSNLSSLRKINISSLTHAYLSIYNIWIPLLIILTLSMFLFPTKQRYLLEKNI